MLRGAGLAPTVTSRTEPTPIARFGSLREDVERVQIFKQTQGTLNAAGPDTGPNSYMPQAENHKDKPIAEPARSVEPAIQPPPTVGSKSEKKAEPPTTIATAKKRESSDTKAADAKQIPISPSIAKHVESTPASQQELGSKENTLRGLRQAKVFENRAASVIRPHPQQLIPRPSPLLMPQHEKTIRVHIGTIEVRAVVPQTAATRTASPQPQPLLSLNRYLKKRNEGRA